MDEQRIKEARYQQDAFSREAETLEAKAHWFRSLTVEERMDMLCEFTDLIFEPQPAHCGAKRLCSTGFGACSRPVPHPRCIRMSI